MNTSTVATERTPNKQPLIAVVGTTTAGKTATAINLARDLGGEVISADSRYLYRGLSIGTAKPTPDEMQGVPHHLIDILDPTGEYSLALYQNDAYRTIDNVLSRHRLPILAGGTPLYVNAVLEGWRIPESPPNPEFRAALESQANQQGIDSLHQQLAIVDPTAAERIAPTNLRRIIRALEIHHQTGQRMSDLEGKQPPPYRILVIGLQLPREELLRRIDQRVDSQIVSGLVDEVRALIAQGVPANAPAMSALGYPEIIAYLEGRLSLDEAIQQIKFHTHRYARHQRTWLRRMQSVYWFSPLESDWYQQVLECSHRFLANETVLAPPDVG